MDDLSNDSKEVVDYADFKSIYTYKYHTQDMHDVSKIRIQSRGECTYGEGERLA